MKITKSFLKWAGGKSQSINFLDWYIHNREDFSPTITGRFIEPFVGSGVVFMNMDFKEYIISDVNKDLTNIYNLLKENGETFIQECKLLFKKENNIEEVYYSIRKQFNETKDIVKRASFFVYLNRHGFNGLCRYNKSGKFNVPFGRYTNVNFPENAFKTVIKKLNNVNIYNQSFEKTIALANQNDVIYADPPYVPMSDTAAFTDYSATGFNMEQQKLLVKLAEESKCRFLISNHDNEVTRELYKNADRIETKEVSRFISADGDSRKKVTELLAIYNRSIK